MEWKKIDDFENYSISSTGQIRNDTTGKILKQTLNSDGYYRVNLSKNGKMETRRVHRLVALAFIPLEPGCDFVDHKDGHPENNLLTNLRWCTQQQNNQNATMRKDNTSGYKGVDFHNGKWRARIKIDDKSIHLGYFNTPEEAAAVRSAKANEVFGVFTNACESV
jgi:hypothetical protein